MVTEIGLRPVKITALAQRQARCETSGNELMTVVDRLAPGEVRRVSACRLTVGDGRWPWADAHRAEIEAGWQRRLVERPKYFNGAVQIMTDHAIADGVFRGSFAATDFASFVHWWDADFPDHSVRDCFGSGILRSAEGHVLLGVQSGGNLNSGKAYFFGGFIDATDVQADRSIDIDGSVMREITEETGLDVSGLLRTPGYILTAAKCSISIGIEFASPLEAEALRAMILANVAREREPELDDVRIVRRLADLDGVPITHFVMPLMRALIEP